VTVPPVPTVTFDAHFDLRFMRSLHRAQTRALRRLLIMVTVLLLATSLGAVQADGGWVFAGVYGLFFVPVLLGYVLMTLALPRRMVDRAWWSPMPYGIGPDGVEWVGHHGVHSRLPWDAISGLTERRDRFVLIGTAGKPVRIIPRRGLTVEVQEAIRAAVSAGVAPDLTGTAPVTADRASWPPTERESRRPIGEHGDR
jgi:hypothetical protein